MAIRFEDLRPRRAAARRRLAVTVTVAAVAGASLLGGGTSVASRAGAPDAIVARPGDTVWGIAVRYAPDDVDRRAYVDAVIDLNGLSGTPEAGQRIRLPQ
jgi:hypothetical protein